MCSMLIGSIRRVLNADWLRQTCYRFWLGLSVSGHWYLCSIQTQTCCSWLARETTTSASWRAQARHLIFLSVWASTCLWIMCQGHLSWFCCLKRVVPQPVGVNVALFAAACDYLSQAKGGCLVPKCCLDVMKGEVNRLIVLTKDSVIHVPYIVPRRVGPQSNPSSCLTAMHYAVSCVLSVNLVLRRVPCRHIYRHVQWWARLWRHWMVGRTDAEGETYLLLIAPSAPTDTHVLSVV